MKRTIATLATIITALTLQLTPAQAQSAPRSLRVLDSASEDLLSSVHSMAKDSDRRNRDRLRAAVEEAREFENAVDRLRSAVENRRNSRVVGQALQVAVGEFRDVDRALPSRSLSRGTRANLERSRAALSDTTRALAGGRGGHYGRGDHNDRDDRRGRGDRNGR